MLNPFSDVNWKPDSSEVRKFGRVLIIGGAILTSLFWVLEFSLKNSFVPDFLKYVFPGIIGAGLIAVIIPLVGRPIYFVWYFLACIIGFIISNLVMGLFYFVIMALFGLALKLRKKDPLNLKPEPGQNSNWHESAKNLPLSSYYRQS